MYTVLSCARAQLLCTGSYVLHDGHVGPVQGYDISNVFAWSEDFDMTFTLPVQTSVTQVNLLFYNNPSIGVGLPNIDGLFWDTTNPYLQSSDLYFTIAGNQDLIQRDAGLHNISLIIASNLTVLPYAFLRIHFSFPSTILVRTLLLSEVQLSNTAGNHPSYVADMSRLLPSFIPTVSPPLTTNISFLPHPSVVTIEPVASQSS